VTETKTWRDKRDKRDDRDHPEDGEADYYAILGVAPDASHETIHQEYRRLAKLWHPDRYTYAPDELRERAERRMRAISRAWTELGDPIRRYAYDRRRHEASWPSISSHPEMGKQMENGAGVFAGMLCVILALPFLINLLSGSLHETWQVVLVAAVVFGLAALAGFFFTGDSPLARMATHWAEGEPHGFYDQPVAYQQTGASGYRFDDAETGDDGDDDAEAERAREFDRLVDQALATIPDEFKPFMNNVLVRVEREATEEELRRMEVGPGGMLFGLYTGVPLTAQGAQAVGTEFVTIYRGPIERYCHGDPERIREQVRRTVLHEVAHHFGIDHDQMPDWLK
jgi:predicted Zn-dependent protease with MMP-like domain